MRPILQTVGILVAVAMIAPSIAGAEGETFHVNPETGSDTNPGTKEKPFKTVPAAADRVNALKGEGGVTIILSPGTHAIDRTVVLKAGRGYTKEDRLTIRAEVLPDDPGWDIGRMPALIHTMPLPSTWNGRPDPLGGAANGTLVETSHVTIRGLKILGLPVVETPRPGQKRRLYGIARLDRTLEDLEVAQCLFVGDEVVAPLHVGIIAQGNGVVVDHCLFRGFTKDAVVYWTPGSVGHAMRNCLFHGMYGSTVWTSGIADDFEYRNNVVDGSKYVWIYQGRASTRADAGGGRAKLGADRKSGEPLRYKVVDCLFAGNQKLAGSGTGARVEFKDIDPSFLEMSGTKVLDTSIEFERDSTKRNYLHPVAGSEAAAIGAGLFSEPVK